MTAVAGAWTKSVRSDQHRPKCNLGFSGGELIAHEFAEKLGAACTDRVVSERAFAPEQHRIQIGDDHFFLDALCLCTREHFAVGSPDECTASVMRLVFVIGGVFIERS